MASSMHVPDFLLRPTFLSRWPVSCCLPSLPPIYHFRIDSLLTLFDNRKPLNLCNVLLPAQTGPEPAGFAPLNGSTTVDPSQTSLLVVFDQNIQFATGGTVIITCLSDGSSRTISFASSEVSIPPGNRTNLIVSLQFFPLSSGRVYQVQIPANGLQGLQGVLASGLLAPTRAYIFTTSGLPTFDVELSPPDNAFLVSSGRSFVTASFGIFILLNPATINTKSIVVENFNDDTREMIPLNSTKIRISNGFVNISISPLILNKAYSIQIPSGVFTSVGNTGQWVGTDRATWNFIVLGSSLCDGCPPGRAGSGDSCATCTAGKYSDGTLTSCASCSAGRFSTSGASFCVPCQVGFYCDHSECSACSPCVSGTESPQVEGKFCSNCTLGRFSVDTVSKTCADCIEGTFANTTAATACQLCPIGRAQPRKGQSTCDICPQGTYSSVAGSSICASCGLGFISLAESSTCSVCSPGFFANVSGLTACYDCDPGFAQPSKGSQSCSPCAAGKYFPGCTASVCVDCEVGRFANRSGLTACTPCSLGTFGPTAGKIASLWVVSWLLLLTFSNC